MSLQQRDRQDEWMDDPTLDSKLHHQALRGLSRVNRISGAARSIWRPLASLGSERQPIRVIDIGSGGGDVAIELKRLSIRKKVPIEIVGLDISGTAIAYAEEQARRRGVEVEFRRQDVLAAPLPAPVDFVYSSLFLHHLEASQIIALLGAMKTAEPRRIVVSDLIRSRIGYWMAKIGIRFLTTSRVCHFDGPASVRAALTRSEMKTLATEAGLPNVRLSKQWPERFLMISDLERRGT